MKKGDATGHEVDKLTRPVVHVIVNKKRSWLLCEEGKIAVPGLWKRAFVRKELGFTNRLAWALMGLCIGLQNSS